jgi:5-methylcytosine-specific restriction protein A
MPTKPKSHQPPGSPRPVPDNRPSARQRGYITAWDHARRAYLAEHPLCVTCYKEGKLVAATVVDHIVPHRGDQERFWDQSNWQALCESCHNAKTVREDGGFGQPSGV